MKKIYSKVLCLFLILSMLTSVSGCAMLMQNIRQEMERQEGSARMQDSQAGEFSCYAKSLFSFFDKKLNLSAGGRFNKHEEFNAHSTWELGLSYAFETNTRIFGRVATGYRTPSLSRRFGEGVPHCESPT